MPSNSIFQFLLLILLITSTTCLVADAAKPQAPNVILVLADDLAIGDFSCVNGGISRTPRLDQLRQESIYFEHAYSGSPVCAPSRAALLTGRYPHRTGSVTLNQRKYPDLTRLHSDEITIADRFSASGYATGLVGKWHSGKGVDYHPLKRGFDEFTGFLDSQDVPSYYRYQLDVQGEYQDFEETYLTDELTDRAIDFVRRHQREPFFLHLAHYAPHRPLGAPPELVARYTAAGLDAKTAKVYAMIEVMDAGVGALLDELDELEIAENTIVIFASDNGPDPVVGTRFNGENRGTKYMVNEGGIHVPFMIRWKGVLEPAHREEIIHFTDAVPTLIELCQLKAPQADKPLDGASFAGLLSQRFATPELPEQRFWQWNRITPLYTHNAAVRDGDWKLVRPFVTRNVPKGESNAAPRLYDLSKDRLESVDLADEHPAIRDRLTEDLNRWSKEVEQDRVR
ncbi:sulfatase-like hydrolase/transferase [Allorhodopirellula solitaria]|uniref:Arylsulfatase n=1 Tax=Allorhodopirellula solitaria TaxID=2527987 RepID=A0A5C5XVP1_9BACT|nr:sulfatase-like hydrolase/transferase [Allorhodopirellula solitaria]TWT67387.1 Arylsulfatase precursor [Allorhodopirellula solitaria]